MSTPDAPASTPMGDVSHLADQAAAAPAAGAEPKKDCTCPARKVNGIVLKSLNFRDMSNVGHSWYEMDGNRSVGWWPSQESWRVGSFFRTRGAVNHGQPRDPHHGDAADTTSDLYTRDGDCRTDEEIQNCVRNFYYAKERSGDVYNIVGGRYCHTIATEAAQHCRVTPRAR